MGNEMGNNNTSGLQESEVSASGADEMSEPLDGSLVKDIKEGGTEDADITETLNGANVEEVLDQQNSPRKGDDSDENSMGLAQDDTSTAEDDQNNRSMSEERDDEAMRISVKEETSLMPTDSVQNEIVEPSANFVETSLPPTTESMISNKNCSGCDQRTYQLVDVIKETIEERNVSNSSSSSEENIEGSLEDAGEYSRNEVVLKNGDLVGDDQETQEQQHLQVATVEDELMPMQMEITSSSESIGTDYLDADDSEIKEVVMEYEPKERDAARPIDGINLEISDNCHIEELEENVEISETDDTKPLHCVICTSEELKQGDRMRDSENNDHENLEYNIADELHIGEVVSQLQSPSTNASASSTEVVMEKKEELKEEGIVSARRILDDATQPVEHPEIVNETVEVQNLADGFGAKNALEEFKDEENLVDHVDVVRDDSVELEASLFDHAPIMSEETLQKKEVNEGGLVSAVMIPANATETLEHDEEATEEREDTDETGHAAEGRGVEVDGELAAFHLPASVPTSSFQPVLDFDKKDGKLRESDSNGGIIPNTGNTQEGKISPQCDHIPPEEPEVVRLESSVILSSHSSATTGGLSAEFTRGQANATAEKTMKDQHRLQPRHSDSEACEEAPLLQKTESMDCFSYSSPIEVQDVSVVNIGMIEVKREETNDHPVSHAEGESEQSPLLSPKKPTEELSVSTNNGRNKKPLQSLMTEDRFATGSLPKNLAEASSSRSKGKQKPRPSLFASCMCCTTATN